MTTFGELIAKRRKKLNLTQKQIAAEIKQDGGKPISAQYLNDIEHGRRGAPPDYIIAQLARLLRLQLDVLYSVRGACRPTSASGRFLTRKPLRLTARCAASSAGRKTVKNIFVYTDTH
jgi:transcriptional regulator with XRE-family HTH domain